MIEIDASTGSNADATAPRLRTALVVGGSLVGLATAIRLARCGLDVTVVERGEAFGADGAGLGIDRRRLSSVVGVSAIDGREVAPLPVVTSNRESTAWSALYRWLRSVADRDARIEIRAGSAVTEVAAEGGRGRVALDSGWLDADIVVGADGRGSVVRRQVAPERPTARYAGYGVWRGMIEERLLPVGTLARPRPVSVNWAENQRLVAYEMPGPDGSVQRGALAVSWGWFDAELTARFQATGCVRGDEVLRSLRPEELDANAAAMLRRRAEALWPEPWRTAILATIDAGRVFATPIAEYLPIRLVAGPLALIGDAAHAVSPMTGAGLATGLEDVEALGRAVQAELAGGRPALPAYGAERLQAARALALSSMQWSQAYMAEAARG